MSAPGGPGGAVKLSKPTPPERGSFPLDHDAECQPIMKAYLKCIRSAKGVNSEDCRRLSQGYLQCRMDRNLMAVDSMRNLGFEDLGRQEVQAEVMGRTNVKGQVVANERSSGGTDDGTRREG